MRTYLAAVPVAVATLVVLAPAAPAAASDPFSALTCTASASIDWSTSGEFAATVTAYVVGTCSIPGWTTCDISLAGVPGILGTSRTAGYGWCESTITYNGLQNTPYVAVGRVGYSAANAPVAAAVAQGVPRR
jgi:hypothetical protein